MTFARLAFALLLTVPVLALRAQSSTRSPAEDAKTQDTTRVSRKRTDTTRISATPVRALTSGDIPKFGVMLIATGATMLLDKPIASFVNDSSYQDNPTYRSVSDALQRVHERSLFFASIVTYGVGRVGHMRWVADMGYHASEAIAIGTAIGSFLKPTIGRVRPYAVEGESPFIFKPGRGYTEGQYRALPSLHEIGSFAAAAVLTEETRRAYPDKAIYVGIFSYGVAGLVGVARIYTGQHWASDVVMGSAMGAFIGKRVVDYAHSRARSRVDRWFLGARAMPDGGTALVLEREF
jgi:membrane-associated phospholipid phosphatase